MLPQNVNELPQLAEMLDQGFVFMRAHPWLPLRIYNYSRSCAGEGIWNDTTMACRGLITDADGRIVARPFEKFFGLQSKTELAEMDTHGTYDLYRKYDGSMATMYFHGTEVGMASRGSFDDKVARLANDLLRERQEYYDALRWMPRNMTYVFELLHPEHPCVVNYGDARQLILLACINTETGVETPSVGGLWPDVAARMSSAAPLADLAATIPEGEEGYVVRYRQTGERVKIKGPWYLKNHHLYTGLSRREIWRMMCKGDDFGHAEFTEMLDGASNEITDWINAARDEFIDASSTMVRELREVVDAAQKEMTRAEFARYLSTTNLNAKIAFMIWNNELHDKVAVAAMRALPKPEPLRYRLNPEL